MSGSLSYYKGKRGILRVTVRTTGLEPVVYRFQVTNLTRQEIDVPAGTDRALLLEYTTTQQATFCALNSTIEGIEVGFTSGVAAPTTATPTTGDMILRPFAVMSAMEVLVWSGSTYPGVVIRNGTAYDARVTILYAAQVP